MRSILRVSLFIALVVAPFRAGFAVPRQYRLTTIATFNSANGANPVAALIADPAGNLYGTTFSGGANNLGTVFEVAAGTHVLSTLVTFDGANGATPSAGLIFDPAGNLYGTTETGGTVNAGTAFKLAAGSRALSTLYSFPGGVYGAYPSTDLVADANGSKLYGTAFGSSNPMRGASDSAFELNTSTNSVTLLSSILRSPTGLTAAANGKLYITEEFGDGASDGAIESLAESGGGLTPVPIAGFNRTTGTHPICNLLLDASGNLYGTTQNDGPGNRGTVFKWDAATKALSVLEAFDGTNGANPRAGLIADASGNFFGTTSGGRISDGTVFEFDAGTQSLTTLLTFDGANGAKPYAPLLADGNGDFFGTTYIGRTGNLGTVFELLPVPEPSTLLLSVIAMISGLLFLPRLRGRWSRRHLTIAISG